MRAPDLLHQSYRSLARSPGRTGLLLLAMAIGVAAVVVLTSLGDGARRYVSGEFASLGTNLLIVIPGRSETTGGVAGIVVGQTPRDLTLDDARALYRHYAVERVAPLVLGSAAVSAGGLEREAPVFGTTREMLELRRWEMGQGVFLPAGDWDRPQSVAVIGETLKKELFGNTSPVGQWLRVGDRRFRVIGVLGSAGRSIGIDTQDVVILPVTSAMALFDAPSLFRILVGATSRDAMDAAARHIRATVAARHQGEEDITVITQDAVLATFDRIFGALTMTLAGIASISLAVAGVLIMNVMLVAVSQRTAEIGLLKAIGAPRRQIMQLFLIEAVMLSLLGALLGLAVGYGGSELIGQLYPALPVGPPPWAVVAAVTVAVASGVIFGSMPARRAARLDPVIALAGR